ncbi:cytochrome C [Geobacter sp. FeAm09]|uniref:cytochrome c3 family protein n=1 Tax=Geobacter sp. FeAm09 TaxID=2597769 RepID=UPI0011EC9889|nr:cytochrome c3 family protein [Geobacter sp. FeAm09]QEM66774.1 cytochrome C [Geobacter sp. FeAm09]QEM70065.1 cytochrome C [Geobacter sp. FeAm09]
MIWGCSPLTRYKLTSTLFDGVPSMPPAEQYCADYAAQVVAKTRAEAEGKSSAAGDAGKASSHNPYDEKKCDNCHDKTTESGLVVKSKNELCFVCHTGFVKGSFVHGPVAVGDCLVCHEPHNSPNPALLKVRPSEVCAACHHEKRQAASLHEKAASHGLICINCHDPHFGNVLFFLK